MRSWTSSGGGAGGGDGGIDAIASVLVDDAATGGGCRFSARLAAVVVEGGHGCGPGGNADQRKH